MSHSTIPKVETVSDEDNLSPIPEASPGSNLEALMRNLAGSEEGAMPPVAGAPATSPEGSELTMSSGFHVVGGSDFGEHKSPTSGSGSGKLTLMSNEWMGSKCQGKIGTAGERICTKDKESCPTKAHQINKTDELVQGYLYIPGSGSSIFVSPAISYKALFRLDGIDAHEVLEQTHTTEEWIRVFNQVALSKEYHASVAASTPKSGAAGSIVSGAGVSPLRVNTDFLEGSDEEGENPTFTSPPLFPNAGNAAAIDSLEDDTLRSILNDHDYKVKQIATDARHLSKSVQIQNLLVTDLRSEVEVLADNLASQPSAEALLGQRPPAFGELSVWQSIEAAASSASGSTSPGIEALAAAANTLFGKIKGLEAKVKARPVPAAVQPPFQMEGLQLEIDHLASRLAIMEERERQAGLVLPDTLSKLGALERGFAELRKQVVGSKVFRFNGMHFGSYEDVLTHLGDSLAGCSIGWFLDLYGALSQIGEVFYEGGDYASVLHASARVQSSTLETTLMGDMKCPGIRYLYDAQLGKKGLVTPDQGFGFRLSTMEKFSGGNGAPERSEISSHVQRLVSSIQGSITGTDICAQLAHNMNNKTQSQNEAMLSFIEQWHGELLMQCNYATKEAWTFIGQCVRAMLDHLTPPRILVSHYQEWRTPENKARIIWAMMQVHIRMDEIIAARFKSHPTITTVMSNFIMKTRVSETAVTDLSKKIKDAANVSPKVAALEAEVKILKASLKKK